MNVCRQLDGVAVDCIDFAILAQSQPVTPVAKAALTGMQELLLVK